MQNASKNKHLCKNVIMVKLNEWFDDLLKI